MNFFSRGKILISGEYAVLDGARALALPTRLGQYLEVKETKSHDRLVINSSLNEQAWYSGIFTLPDMQLLESTDETKSLFLKEILVAASALKPGFFNGKTGFELLSTLEFDTRWGLGSSSSLISNLAWWMNIDPFELFWKVSSGSGFDIACARSASPLIYQMEDHSPNVEPVDFQPGYNQALYFVYLGNKQDSQYSVMDYRERVKPDPEVIREISGLSGAICRADSLENFEELINYHEKCLSDYLGLEPVKKSRFPGFGGSMKSLGAWGGDMVLVTWKGSEEELRKYFESKGLKLIFRYDDLI